MHDIVALRETTQQCYDRFLLLKDQFALLMSHDQSIKGISPPQEENKTRFKTRFAHTCIYFSFQDEVFFFF